MSNLQLSFLFYARLLDGFFIRLISLFIRLFLSVYLSPIYMSLSSRLLDKPDARHQTSHCQSTDNHCFN